VAVGGRVGAELTLGAVLPAGAGVAGVRLDGRAVAYRVDRTARGAALTVAAGRAGTHLLVIELR
jgi:hypothetical protein